MQRADLAAKLRTMRLVFGMGGVGLSVWAMTMPYTKLRFHLDDGTLGLMLLAGGSGGILCMPFAGMAVARWGSRKVILATGAVFGLLLPALSTVPTPAAFTALLLLYGALFGALDIAMNAQGAVIERLSTRRQMSGFHACYSLGSLAVTVLTSLLLRAGLVLPRLRHARHRAGAGHPHPDEQTGAKNRGSTGRPSPSPCPTAPAWRSACAASPASSPKEPPPTGAPSTCASRAACRSPPQRSATPPSPWPRPAPACSATAWSCAWGLPPSPGSAAPWPSPGCCSPCWCPPGLAGIIGFGLVGFGTGNIAPLIFSAAARIKGLAAHHAVPAVVGVGYAEFLTGPVLIGLISNHLGLGTALLMNAVLLAGLFLCR